MFSRRARVAVASASIALAACRPPPPAPLPPPPPPAPIAKAPSHVLDALSVQDRAWSYVDARTLRDGYLPDLLHAVSALRADVEVGFAILAAKCGYQPLFAVDDAFLRVAWQKGVKRPDWSAVFRMQDPQERHLACLRAFVPEVEETTLDGHAAFQLPKMFVVWDDGVFVAASSGIEARVTLQRLMHPEPGALQARTNLAGVIFDANVVSPNPFGLDELRGRWTVENTNQRLAFHSRFSGTSNARRAETIVHDGLTQVLGASASADPAQQSIAARFVQGVTMTRNDSVIDATFDMGSLAGQTALVSRVTSIAAHSVRLYNAWELMGEARDTVYFIARGLADYAVRLRAEGRSVRFPPSAPMVPDEIPYGKAVLPNPHSFLHPSWQDIHFSSDRPTFYACNFVTAKDGKSVVVRAHGDIDGDGTTSLFELDVRLDARGVPVIAPIIRERDPEE